jgi:hypothetical protein
MGAPACYKLGQTYNETYHAMGDAVAVPAAEFLSANLLGPLADCATDPIFMGLPPGAAVSVFM